jgi:hypothetical protein
MCASKGTLRIASTKAKPDHCSTFTGERRISAMMMASGSASARLIPVRLREVISPATSQS